MAFVKGQSGNPGGRPKAVMPDGRTLSEAAREHSPEALRVLVEALSNPDTALAAAKEILDRGFGRPAQALEITGEDGGPVQVSRIELVGVPAVK
jgi:hypothetical protein